MKGSAIFSGREERSCHSKKQQIAKLMRLPVSLIILFIRSTSWSKMHIYSSGDAIVAHRSVTKLNETITRLPPDQYVMSNGLGLMTCQNNKTGCWVIERLSVCLFLPAKPDNIMWLPYLSGTVWHSRSEHLIYSTHSHCNALESPLNRRLMRQGRNGLRTRNNFYYGRGGGAR